DRRWLRGGFPEAWLARSHAAAFLRLENFVRTFLERDLPGLGVRVPGPTLRRFWTMLAHWHGQIWNSSEFARSFGVSDRAVRRYLDLLTGALVDRQLQPWHANNAKRQVRAPKIYLRDTGVLHALLGIGDLRSLNSHPKSGASWEGFVLETLIDRLSLQDDRCTSGRRTAARSWICSLPAGAGESGSRSSAPARRESRDLCARRSTTSTSRRPLSSTPAVTLTGWPPEFGRWRRIGWPTIWRFDSSGRVEPMIAWFRRRLAPRWSPGFWSQTCWLAASASSRGHPWCDWRLVVRVHGISSSRQGVRDGSARSYSRRFPPINCTRSLRPACAAIEMTSRCHDAASA
ncbi:MAG: DUF4143 domain-containing protein, partial [Acidobacteria bacterium]|nr:DUF4143 domain-containing protein [Acidobacteriota bacterium]